ncbi:MAG: LON peptidase substrate-binding domain-containing protein [Bryobacteraceae bacterium]|jgi:Lon protease-like protein
MSRLLPLFPLELVAFPGAAIPLHIFEDRYKEMVGEAQAAGTEFGIVLAKEGGVVNAGCTVVVESVLNRYADGRFDVLTRGQRRFSLVAIDRELAYLRGEVEYFEDTDLLAVPRELRRKAIGAWEQIRKALLETGAEVRKIEPDPDNPQLSFQLAQGVDDLDFQSLLLRSQSETERLGKFLEFAREYVPRKQYAAKMKRNAPQNGSGHRPTGL